MAINLSASLNEQTIVHPSQSPNLSFPEYISVCRSLIKERRIDINNQNFQKIIDANSPYELYPAHPICNGDKIKYGVLLIHGLLDCPFSLKEIGEYLQTQGILSKAILLPGHGTIPSDLLNVTYEDWLETVRYGVQSLQNEVDHIFLMGYSTGAALSVLQALQDEHIAGIILLSPAIKIKAPVNIVVAWHLFKRWLGRNNRDWLYREDENDYAKYKSIVFNAVSQVSKLTTVLFDLGKKHQLQTPMFMVLSREDETVSSHKAIDFFSSKLNQESKLLLYTSKEHRYPDARIITRLTEYPNLHVKHFSHVSIPFSPANPHYGEQGDYIYASHKDTQGYTFGAFNLIEIDTFDVLNKLKLSKYRRRELTYNPDFNFMVENILKFILDRN